MSHEAAIPRSLAPLNGLKCRYLEIVNPLLSRRIISLVRTFPDELRMHGRAFSEIVDRESRLIPHARFTSIPAVSEYLADAEVIKAVVAELTSTAVESVISEEAAMMLLAGMVSPSHSPVTVRSRAKAAMRAVRPALPSRVAYRLMPRYQGPEPLTAMQLAFRATIASKTVAMLREDAATLDEGASSRRRAGISGASSASSADICTP